MSLCIRMDTSGGQLSVISLTSVETGEFVYTYGLTLYKAIEILPICRSEGIVAAVIFAKTVAL